MKPLDTTAEKLRCERWGVRNLQQINRERIYTNSQKNNAPIPPAPNIHDE